MMRSIGMLVTVITGVTCLYAVACRAHEQIPDAVPERQQHEPSRMPDRIVLTWSGDPARSQNVCWRTNTEIKSAFVQLAVAQPGPYFVPDAKRVDATTSPFTSDLDECHLHVAQLTDLQPKTKYVYRVGDGANFSEWFHFTTASNKPDPFTFIYFGDAQNSVKEHWSRVIREAHLDAPRASFMLHAGDLINRANRDAEWGEWFGAGAWLNAMIPSIATPGNHEYSSGTLSGHWRPQFAFPMNGPEDLKESVYYLDYQGTRIISLNSNDQQKNQVAWLDEVLADNPNKWTVITFHHPMYSAAKNRDNPQLRGLWKPIFDKYHVDLVLQGHDHAYARSKLDLPQNVPEGTTAVEGGTVYVVSVSGPKLYDVKEGRPFISRSASGAQLYQIIRVEDDELHYEARVATGELYDAFRLKKRPGKTNELIEMVPDTDEIRKP